MKKTVAILLVALVLMAPIVITAKENVEPYRAPSVCYDDYGNGYSEHKMCSKLWANAVRVNYDGTREVVFRNANLFQCDRCNHVLASQLDVNVMGMPGNYADRPYPYRISREQLLVEFSPSDFKYSESIPYGFRFEVGCGW